MVVKLELQVSMIFGDDTIQLADSRDGSIVSGGFGAIHGCNGDDDDIEGLC